VPFEKAGLGSWAPSFWRSVLLSFSLRRFAAKYFSQLDVEFESLCTVEYKALVAEEVEALRAHEAKRPSWKLNHRYEHLVLDGLPASVLLQRAAIFRARLLALVGADTTAFEAAHPPLNPETPLPVLREQARGLLSEIQRLRLVRSEFDRLRNRLIAASMVPGFVFAGLALWFAPLFWGMPLARVAAILGLFGGYLSVLLRVGSLKWALSYAANYQQVDRLFWNLFLNFYLSLLEGCLGAIVVYIAFSAGLLQGDLFPHIPDTGHELVWARDLDHGTFARLMLWCIAAGFSERAVPDILSGLGKDLTRLPAAGAEADKK
jgi:hypothetical protein